MSEQKNSNLPQTKIDVDLLHRLEERVARIEAYLEFGPAAESSLEQGDYFYKKKLASRSALGTSEELSLEFRIGEYWLAQIGTAVLLLGIAFFISYPFRVIPPILASLLGYVAVTGIFGLSHYWQRTYQYLSRILFGAGLVLLYFATLRLHFFNSTPVISSKTAGLAILVTILALNLYASLKRRSEILTGITLILCYSTSLISNTVHFALAFITISSAIVVYILVRFNWHTAALLSVGLAFSSQLLLFVNNPVLGNPVQAISEHQNHLVYLVLYGTLFAVANILRNKASYSDLFEFLLAAMNGIGIVFIGSLVVLTFFKPNLSAISLLTSIFFIAMAAINWKRHQSKYSTSIYACFGYVALSIAIFTQFKSPNYYIWLGWESILVITTAIWFRSRIIIVATIFIYLVIFIGYLRLAPSNDFVNLSYAIAALTSARVLNWKKERLELKTDLIRNAYLGSAYVIVLYGLYHAVPSSYVSLSWLGAALFYFGISVLLKNIKYRWMAILTIFAMIIHVFVIDMARLAAEFRIILFLAVGLALLAVSLIYARHRIKPGKSEGLKVNR